MHIPDARESFLNPIPYYSYHLRDTAMELFLRRGQSRTLFVDFGRDAPRDKRRRDHFVWRMAQFLPSAWCFGLEVLACGWMDEWRDE